MKRHEHRRCTLSIPILEDHVITVVYDNISQELDGSADEPAQNGTSEVNDSGAGSRGPMGFQPPAR